MYYGINHVKYKAALVLFVALLSSVHVLAGTTLYTDRIKFEADAGPIENFTTTADNIILADEVDKTPESDTALSATLTFNKSNTGLSRSFELATLQQGAEFVFDDGVSSIFTDALSVGKIDEYENDDWSLTLQDGLVMRGFGFE